MAKIAAYRNNSEKETAQILEVAIGSFKQLIRKIKFNSVVKNPFAYFYGILDKKFTRRYYEELYEMDEENQCFKGWHSQSSVH